MKGVHEIHDWQVAVHDLARAKGWWPRDLVALDVDFAPRVLAKLALVHSEISEAVEAVRDGNIDLCYGPEGSGKPEGMVIELADAVIRIMDLCQALGLSLEEAMAVKHEYNQTRPHRHGGKRA